jgi:hypothetical protein
MLPLVHPFYWGMWFVAAPVLIHLINMLRHQRVEWAAMEFLLISQKKHRTWVILKQLLLLLLRIAAIALVVLALAQPLLPDRWGSFLGAQPTHHIVLLDDSYSMSENLGGGTAFDQAKKVIQRLGESVTHPREPQTFTLLRFSRCAGRYGGATRPDFHNRVVDSRFAEDLASALDAIQVSQTAAEPLPSFDAIQQLLDDKQGEHRIVYLLSDFRARQWDKPDELKKRLADLDEKHAEIQLVDCVEESSRPNLAITALEPEEGIRARDVPWRMQVTVQNYGTSAVRNVPVSWKADGDAKKGGSFEIAEIAPGGSEQKAFEVTFSVAGEHLVEAGLEADAVTFDNKRFAVVDVPVTTPVLLVDGGPTATNSRLIAMALKVHKGVQPEIVPPAYLSAPKRPLSEFAMICVANFGKIERAGVEALEGYVAAGGGVLFVTGGLTKGEYVTKDLYREGKGLFPLPLSGPEQLRVDPLDNSPDVTAEDHYVFRKLEHRAENISKIHVNRYFAAPPGWKQGAGSGEQGVGLLAPGVIMRLRNGAPLMVEKSFGKGRVVAFLSTTSGRWNNWPDPEPNSDKGSFVVFVFDVIPYLSHRFGGGNSLLVGEPKNLTFSSPPFDPAVRFSGPRGDVSAVTVNSVSSGADHRTATYAKTETSGFYKALLTLPSLKTEVRNFAVNVDPGEGDLKALAGPDLLSRLAPLAPKFMYASKYELKVDETQGRNLGDLFLLLLLIVLIVEQWFAWSCSYHVSSPPVPRVLKEASHDQRS